MRAIVIGYGSIGQRHVRLLQSLNIETAVVSQRKVDFPTVFSNIAEAINIFNPQYIVISNKTNEHFETVAYLLSNHWSGKTLVEKPLFHRNITTALDPAATEIFVGYNLRFHPILQKLKQDLSGKKIVSVMVYTGQYLPSWRPERDYTLSYSARQE
ncbi:oxidoreductase, partial [Paenibacillus riograndensis]